MVSRVVADESVPGKISSSLSCLLGEWLWIEIIVVISRSVGVGPLIDSKAGRLVGTAGNAAEDHYNVFCRFAERANSFSIFISSHPIHLNLFTSLIKYVDREI